MEADWVQAQFFIPHAFGLACSGLWRNHINRFLFAISRKVFPAFWNVLPGQGPDCPKHTSLGPLSSSVADSCCCSTRYIRYKSICIFVGQLGNELNIWTPVQRGFLCSIKQAIIFLITSGSLWKHLPAVLEVQLLLASASHAQYFTPSFNLHNGHPHTCRKQPSGAKFFSPKSGTSESTEIPPLGRLLPTPEVSTARVSSSHSRYEKRVDLRQHGTHQKHHQVVNLIAATSLFAPFRAWKKLLFTPGPRLIRDKSNPGGTLGPVS